MHNVGPNQPIVGHLRGPEVILMTIPFQRVPQQMELIGAHIDGTIQEDPGDGFEASWLRQRAFVGYVVAGAGKEVGQGQRDQWLTIAWEYSTKFPQNHHSKSKNVNKHSCGAIYFGCFKTKSFLVTKTCSRWRTVFCYEKLLENSNFSIWI